jgi:phage terminase small subunit
MADKLTPKQLRFIDEYLVDLNATQAAIRAGYSEKTAKQIGSKLLTKVDITTRIEGRKNVLHKKVELSQEWVLEKLKECVAKSMQEEEVQKWDYDSKQMIGTGEYIYDSKGATKALELLGKHLGIFNEKLTLDGKLVMFSGEDNLED